MAGRRTENQDGQGGVPRRRQVENLDKVQLREGRADIGSANLKFDLDLEQVLPSAGLAGPVGPTEESSKPAGSGRLGQKPLSKAGHRKRLRERFLKGGPDAVPDYELIELILFRAIARRDTKDLAKRLLARFGTFAGVVNAPAERLKEIDGVGDSVVTELKLIHAAGVRMIRSQVIGKPVLSTWSMVIDYVKAAQAHEGREIFRILFLDKRNRLIGDEVQGRGTVDHTPVYIREVVKRALELSATAIVLVHNHPSGDPTPSRADIEMTRLICAAAGLLGIVVHDHIIVGRDGHCSFKALKLL